MNKEVTATIKEGSVVILDAWTGYDDAREVLMSVVEGIRE